MSSKTFDIAYLSDNLPDLLLNIQNHVEITLTKQGVPWVKVLPLDKQEQVAPKVGLNHGSMITSDDFDDESEEINAMFYNSVIFPH